MVNFRGYLSVVSVAAIASFSLGAGALAEGKREIEIIPEIPHSLGMNSAALSPDDSLVLSGGQEGTLELRAEATGQLIRTFRGHTSRVNSVAFSPDGSRALSGSGGASGGSAVASEEDDTLRLWDLATGQLIRTFRGHAESVNSVAFSPDGRQVLSGSRDSTIKLWDVATGTLVRTFEGHTNPVNSVAFSPDGTLVVSGSGITNKRFVDSGDNTLKLWDVATGQLLRTFKGHEATVNSVVFSPDGLRLLSGSDDTTLKLWDVATGGLVHTFEVHSGAVWSVAFSPDGRQVLSGGEDAKPELWDAATGKLLRTFEGPTNSVYWVAFSPDGREVLAGSYDTVRLWDAATGRLLRSFGGRGGRRVSSIAFSPHGARALSGSGDGTVTIWDLAAGQPLRTFKGHSGDVLSVAFSPDGRQVLSGSWDDTVKLWDAAKGVLVRTFNGHSSPVSSVAFSPDGRQVLSGSYDNTVRLWDVATGRLLRTFSSEYITSVAFSPDGREVLSGGGDDTAKLWDAATGALVQTFEGHGLAANVTSVAFSPDGRQVLSGGRWDGTIKLWDVATGQLLRTFKGHETKVNSAVFSPDGRQVLSGSSDNTVRLWEVATGQLLRTFNGHVAAVTSVAFSPDGQQVLSGSEDTTLKLWQPETGDLLASSIAVSRTGKVLTTSVAPSQIAWLTMTPEGFFTASPAGNDLLSVVRGLGVTSIEQIHQSLYNPDLVREELAGDPDKEFEKAAKVVNLEKVLDSGKVPAIEIIAPKVDGEAKSDLIDAEATITDTGGGIGRIEWRLNGVTVGVESPPRGSGKSITVKRQLALDAGGNTVEVVAYNGRNLLASLPEQLMVTYAGPADTIEPNLYVLAIGINNYVDEGGLAPGETEAQRFPPLRLAVSDAKALGEELQKAGAGLYGEVHVQTVLDEEATAANLDAVVTQMAGEISPRDTFVLFAAAHGYSHEGRFYLIPQDYQGGPDPQALAALAIDQFKLQDWIANRIRAKKVLILLDTCESGALTSGYTRSRFDGPASEASMGGLHEATGRPVLTAAALGQDALEFTELGHGVFTSAVIDSLHRGDRDGDGKVSVAELAAHVQDLVPKLIRDPAARAKVARRGLVGGVQSARFGSKGEDFALVQRLQ